MKSLKIFALVLISLFLMSCSSTYRLNMSDAISTVSGFDSENKDILTIHCRTPMNLIVDFKGTSLLCKSGGKITLSHRFTLMHSDRSSGRAKIPVLIYPKDVDYSGVRGETNTWNVSRNRDSNESWLIQLEDDRLDIDEAH